MIPHLQSGGRFGYVPPTWDQDLDACPAISAMQSFDVGEHVFVSQFMGQRYYPLREGVVVRAFTSRPGLFRYEVQVGQSLLPVREDWLVPVSTVIAEALEPEDFTSGRLIF